MLGSTREHNLVTSTPLKFLLPFFQIPAYIPMRQSISIDISIAEPKTIFVLKDGNDNSKKYQLVVAKSCLKLFYAVFLPNLKERWLSSIASLGLRRNLQVPKGNFITVPSGSMSCRFSNAFNFSILPGSITLFFVKSKSEYGNWKNTKLVYENVDVTSVKVFKAGHPIEFNKELSDLDVKNRNGADHIFLFNQFVQLFGEKAAYETMESFFKEMWIYCIPLCRNPRVGKDFGITPRAEDRQLSFGEPSTLDIDFTFKTAPDEELVCHVVGWYDIVTGFNSYGEILDN